MWWNVIDVLVCLLKLTRLCCNIGIVPVGFRWSVEPQQDGAVVDVFLPLPASGRTLPLPHPCSGRDLMDVFPSR